MRPRLWLAVLGVLALAAGAAYAGQKHFNVVPFEFDPANSELANAAWLSGIGCPSNVRAEVYGPTGIEEGTVTDPDCAVGDPNDKKVEGLLLAKTGTTAVNVAANAAIQNVKGEALTELGYDLRQPGAAHLDPRGSQCGAGAPRFTVVATDPATRRTGTYFVGCNSPPPTTQSNSDLMGFIRLRWGGAGATPLLAAPQTATVPCPGGPAVCNIRGFELRELQIVFDEGWEVLPDQFGVAILDNIDVNGILVGEGPTGSN